MNIGRLRGLERTGAERVTAFKLNEQKKAEVQKEQARVTERQNENTRSEGFRLISPFKEGNVLQGMADTIKKFSAVQEQKTNSTYNFFVEDEETTGQVLSCYG